MLVYLEKQKDFDRFCLYIDSGFIDNRHLLYLIVSIKNNKIIDYLLDNPNYNYSYISFQELEELLKNKN